MNFTDEDLKYMTMTSLTRSLTNIYNCYSIIYDMYHSQDCDRDAVFIHDLADAIKGIEAVLEVYTRDKHIHPSYACEKLHYLYSNIKHVHDYFESKLKKENKNE